MAEEDVPVKSISPELLTLPDCATYKALKLLLEDVKSASLIILPTLAYIAEEPAVWMVASEVFLIVPPLSAYIAYPSVEETLIAPSLIAVPPLVFKPAA